MNRRILGLALAGGFAAVTVAALAAATLARGFDPYHACDTGFSRLVSCTYHRSSTTHGRSRPIFPAASTLESNDPAIMQPTFEPTRVEITSWAVAHCPRNAIARRLLCPAEASAEAASDDATTGLPVPKPWIATTAKKSVFIESIHVETPLGLSAALGFYRAELSRRGWTEHGNAAVDPDRAVIAFDTPDGAALLRLAHQDGWTTADLSLRRPATTDSDSPPTHGQVKLMLGNATDEAADITIDGQTFELAARTGLDLNYDPDTARRSRDAPEISLPPGRHQLTLNASGGAAQSRTFDVAAGETWGLLAGPAGVPLPVQLY